MAITGMGVCAALGFEFFVFAVHVNERVVLQADKF